MEKDIYKRSRMNYILGELVHYLITLLITGAYLAKLTLSLGFSDSLTALLASFVNLGCVFQLLSIRIFGKGRVKKKVTVFFTIAELLFVLLYLTPFLEGMGKIRTVIFVLFLLGGYFLINIAVSPKTNWYMALVDDGKRGIFTAGMEAVSLIGGVVFTFLIGLMVEYYDGIGNQKAAFLCCSGIILCLSLCHTLFLCSSREKERGQLQKVSLLKAAKEAVVDKNTLSIIVLSCLWAICNAITTPFLGTYQVKELGFSMTYVAFLTMIYALSRISASIFLGMYADRSSFTKMLRICYLLVSVSFMAIVFSHPTNGHITFLIYQIFMAAAMGGINSSQINLVFDMVEPEKRMSVLSVKNTFSGILGFGATLVATPLLNFLQNTDISIFGIKIYAQQILGLASFIITIYLIAFVSSMMKNKMLDKQI